MPSDEKKSGPVALGSDGKPSLTPDQALIEIGAGRMTMQEAAARLMSSANLPPSPFPRSAGTATALDDTRVESRRRLETSAGIMFDVVYQLVDYRVMNLLGRDRVRDSRESSRVSELRRRFAIAMINFARDLIRASRTRLERHRDSQR